MISMAILTQPPVDQSGNIEDIQVFLMKMTFISSSEIKKKMFHEWLCFWTITYVVGTQKNCLNETVLLSTKNKFLN